MTRLQRNCHLRHQTDSSPRWKLHSGGGLRRSQPGPKGQRKTPSTGESKRVSRELLGRQAIRQRHALVDSDDDPSYLHGDLRWREMVRYRRSRKRHPSRLLTPVR